MTLSKNSRTPYTVSIEAPNVLFWVKKSSIMTYLPSFVLICSASTESAHVESSKENGLKYPESSEKEAKNFIYNKFY
jgi:hypothetical protein